MSQKKNVLIIFGGKSGEHEVSVRSALSIQEHIDRSKYEPYVLGITQDGRWNLGRTIESITSGQKVLSPSHPVALPSEPGINTLTVSDSKELKNIHFDIIFPIVHGTHGEDGKLQGLLEMANLPYVGAGVLGSALAMDKVVQKQLCGSQGIPQAQFCWLTKTEWKKSKNDVLERIESQLTYPVFVKPANLGSSVGITKVKDPASLETAIETALTFDHKVIVEQGIRDILEIEVSVLGNHEPQASVCGSIRPNTEFYDYETKYITDDIAAQIPAEIPEDISQNIRDTAVKAFTLLNCIGMARTDFFYQPETKTFYLNEINTLPGFTSISMYPKLWEATGLSYSQLITKLLELAQEAWEEKQQLKYSYT